MTSEAIVITEVKTTKTMSIADIRLAAIALELHGGGYNVKQTADAMEWHRMVKESATPVEFTFKGREFTVLVNDIARTHAPVKSNTPQTTSKQH